MATIVRDTQIVSATTLDADANVISAPLQPEANIAILVDLLNFLPLDADTGYTQAPLQTETTFIIPVELISTQRGVVPNVWNGVSVDGDRFV